MSASSVVLLLFETFGTARNTPEIMDNFRMPHGTSDTVVPARARAFADAAAPLKAEFFALAHPANFIEALRQRVMESLKSREQVARGDGVSNIVEWGDTLAANSWSSAGESGPIGRSLGCYGSSQEI